MNHKALKRGSSRRDIVIVINSPYIYKMFKNQDLHVAYLYHRIDNFIRANDRGYKQGDKAWVEVKKKTIGGSEIAVIAGKNKYSNLYKLIEQKIGLGTPFRGDIKTYWGNLFEEVAQLYVEADLDTRIVHTECFLNGKIPEQTYSPDGLGVVNMCREYTHTHISPDGTKTVSEYTVKENIIALFEFKCPFSRIPDGSIPEYYEPQVKTGLDTISVSQIGIYAELVIRRCAYSDMHFDNSNFDRKLKQYADKNAKYPIALGFIGFYIDDMTAVYDDPRFTIFTNWLDSTDDPEYASMYTTAVLDEVNDLSFVPLAPFEALLALFVDKKIRVAYSPVVTRTHRDKDIILEKTRDEFEKHCRDNKYTILGILPWKLLRIDYHYVDKEEGYINNFADKIREVISVVSECNEHPDRKVEIYQQYVMSKETPCDKPQNNTRAFEDYFDAL